MPYIRPSDRDELDSGVRGASTPGELNYILTVVAIDYVNRLGLSYDAINDVLGALDGCGREFYRRVAAPYEDEKAKQNGDLPWPRVPHVKPSERREVEAIKAYQEDLGEEHIVRAYN